MLPPEPARALLFWTFALVCCPAAAISTTDQSPEQLDEVTVQGVRERLEQAGRLAETIEKTEVITQAQIERRQAGNLAQAIDNTPGIRVQNECSMCGIKRVMINGLKGEQTTILVDGVPMHSVVSSYYGIDAITAAGIGSIEVARGAGAALATPEAIGGAINLISERATANRLRVDLSAGSDGYRRGSVVGTGLAADGLAEGLFALQYDDIDAFDGDGNGVTESAALRNRSVLLRGSRDLGEVDHLDARLAVYRSEVAGGPAGASRAAVIDSLADGESEPFALFEGGDVRRRYLGRPWETAELIDSDREEGMLRWTRQLTEQGDNLQVTGSLVRHAQDSFYEGFDYRNNDRVRWFDVRYSRGLSDGGLLSVGTSLLSESMRSESDTLQALQAEDPSITGDSFDYDARGLYAQADLYFGEAVEWSLAARLDRIRADYLDQPGGDEIDRTLFSPRALLKWRHTEQLTSRFSVGRGYRAPLSFFESDHGLLDAGYEVEVDDVERSLSVGYALSYDSPDLALTASLNSTTVEKIAFIDFDGPRPVLRNSTADVRVDAVDVEFNRRLSEHWTVGGGGEVFRYDRAYRSTFAIAPIEERLRLFADYAGHGWTGFMQLTWVGSRDLSRYDTAERFNVLTPAGDLQAPKGTRASAYLTLDARLERALDERWSVYVGGNNLTDYNQAADEESPLYFDGDGGYDVVHIYAPLRGRVLYLGVKAGW